jgi:hypothetical protein
MIITLPKGFNFKFSIGLLLFAFQATEYLLPYGMDCIIITLSLLVPIETNIKNKVLDLDPY